VKKRSAKVKRNTAETRISLALMIDGSGKSKVSTGIPFFDHMLTLLAKHSLCDLTVTAVGDVDVDAHHTVEDIGIALGQAFMQALGDKRGIRRYGWALVPMDETLAQARIALDFSNRPFLVFEAKNWSHIANVSLGRKKEFRVGLVKESCRVLPTRRAVICTLICCAATNRIMLSKRSSKHWQRRSISPVSGTRVSKACRVPRVGFSQRNFALRLVERPHVRGNGSGVAGSSPSSGFHSSS